MTQKTLKYNMPGQQTSTIINNNPLLPANYPIYTEHKHYRQPDRQRTARNTKYTTWYDTQRLYTIY